MRLCYLLFMPLRRVWDRRDLPGARFRALWAAAAPQRCEGPSRASRRKMRSGKKGGGAERSRSHQPPGGRSQTGATKQGSLGSSLRTSLVPFALQQVPARHRQSLQRAIPRSGSIRPQAHASALGRARVPPPLGARQKRIRDRSSSITLD